MSELVQDSEELLRSSSVLWDEQLSVGIIVVTIWKSIHVAVTFFLVQRQNRLELHLVHVADLMRCLHLLV